MRASSSPLSHLLCYDTHVCLPIVAALNDGRAWDLDGCSQYGLPTMLTTTEEKVSNAEAAEHAWEYYLCLRTDHHIDQLFTIQASNEVVSVAVALTRTSPRY